MAHIKESIFINAPVDKVHGLANDPHKWATWYTGLGEAEVSEPGEVFPVCLSVGRRDVVELAVESGGNRRGWGCFF